MSTTIEQIKTSAQQNAEILGILADTDYSTAAHEQQTKFVQDLRHELQGLDRQIADLERSRKSELKDHEKYQKSIVKRFAYKATGQKDKFAAKADKEEKEYFAALNEEHKAKSIRGTLQDRLREAEAQQAKLSEVTTRHGDAQKRLDNLYDAIFEGPTPDFPEEDRAERTAEGVLSDYHTARTRWESTQQARHILDQAQARMHGVVADMDSARDYSRADMFGSGRWADAMERNSLHQAEVGVMEVVMIVMQAQRMDPQVASLPPVSIAKGSLMGDVLFDNIFSDMDFHDRIKTSQDEVLRAQAALAYQAHQAADRLNQQRAHLHQEERRLMEARVELQKTRQRIFENTMSAAA